MDGRGTHQGREGLMFNVLEADCEGRAGALHRRGVPWVSPQNDREETRRQLVVLYLGCTLRTALIALSVTMHCKSFSYLNCFRIDK